MEYRSLYTYLVYAWSLKFCNTTDQTYNNSVLNLLVTKIYYFFVVISDLVTQEIRIVDVFPHCVSESENPRWLSTQVLSTS